MNIWIQSSDIWSNTKLLDVKTFCEIFSLISKGVLILITCALSRRWTSRRQRKLIARTRNAGSTRCIRLPSTRRARIAFLYKENAGMIVSSPATVDRQSLFSTRRYIFDCCLSLKWIQDLFFYKHIITSTQFDLCNDCPCWNYHIHSYKSYISG